MTTTNTPDSVPGSVQRTDDPNTPGDAADAQPSRVNRQAHGARRRLFSDDQVHRLHRRDRRGAACVLPGQGVT